MTQPKAKKVAIPKTLSKCAALVERIGQLTNQLDSLETRMKKRVADLETKFKQDSAPIANEIDAAYEVVRDYATANRKDLLPGDAKTATLTTGELVWKTSPESVALSLEEQVIVDALKAAKLKGAVKVKETVDKTELKKHKDKYKKIPGIKFVQEEKFSVVPNGAKLKRADVVRTLDAA